MAADTLDRIDIARLQNLLGVGFASPAAAAPVCANSGQDLESLPVTQVVSSPPRAEHHLVPRTPAKGQPPPVTPVTHSHSHDHAGDLSLAYSNSLPYTQPDLGVTQPDTPCDFAWGPDMVRDTPDGSSPLKDPGRNPLARLPFGTRVPLSLAQLFEDASSPRRPLAAGNSLPPTPGVAAATRLMVRSFSDLMAPTAEDVTPAGSPTQPDYLLGYVTMQESQDARERARASVSPVVFGSSLVVRGGADVDVDVDMDSDDGMVSSGEETRRRADRARRKGDEEVKRLFAAAKAAAGAGAGGRARSEEAAEKRPAQRHRRHANSASPLAEDTGDEEEAPPAATRPNSGVSATTDDDDVSLPMGSFTAAAAAAAGDHPPLAPHTQYTRLLPHAWESLHRVPAAGVVRRARSNLTATATAPVPSPQPQKTWLRSLPPFNIPSPAARPVPDFVQETSGLVAPPESSPGAAPPGKRKRDARSEDRVPCSLEEMGFGAMDEARGFLSSRPEPDDVDMVGIVADVGAGRDPTMNVPPPPRRTAKRVKLATPARPAARAKSKPPVRKTRSSIAPPPETDDETDILTSRNPAFSLSLSAPPPPPPPPPADDDATITVPERVFALFRDGKTSYHPATVLEGDPYTGTVRVVFDDGTEDLLERVYVRALDLRRGDAVKVDIAGMKKATWEVQGFGGAGTLPDCRGHTAVSLKPRKPGGGGAEPVLVPVSSIYLVKGMWKDFHARVYRELPLAAAVSPAAEQTLCSAPNTPANAPRHTPIAGSFSTSVARPLGGGVFAGMVFALSFGDKESVRDAIAAKILQNGGRIVDVGFEELFHDRPAAAAASLSSSFGSDTTAPGTTTTATTTAAHFAPRPETDRVGFVAVIANTHSRRAKFLQALALGLPCLAPRWIEDCVRRARVVAWEHYLLAAGESSHLGAVRSRTLAGYDARAARLHAVVARRPKLLHGRGVVVVVAAAAARRACERRVRAPPPPPPLTMLTCAETVLVLGVGARCGEGREGAGDRCGAGAGGGGGDGGGGGGDGRRLGLCVCRGGGQGVCGEDVGTPRGRRRPGR